MVSRLRGLSRVGLSGLITLFWVVASPAATSISGASGLTVTVESTGVYNVTIASPAWRFAGNVGYFLDNLATGSGSDALGAYSEITFDFRSDAPRHAAIRSYLNFPGVSFTFSASADAPNTFAFPAFTTYPKGLYHITYSGMFAYPTFYGFSEDSPWFFYDSSANTFVLSPVTNLMVASTIWGANGALQTGISTQIPILPQGFQHQTLLVIESGINRAFDTWGQAMTGLHGKTRPANDADLSLNKLGYWTDAGASYYYTTEPQLSYTDTLSAVKADFDRQGIGLGYLQLDSWFYPKGPGADWADRGEGMYGYFAAAPLFSSSLSAFQRAIGVPLITHARWIDPGSPYRQQYRMSGDVSTDPLYWGDIARYLSTSGVITYEQDWLSDQAKTAFNLTDPDAFLDNMSAALGQQNMSMQYCMPTTRHLMQSSKYNNLLSVRVSEDRFDHTRWRSFLYASRLASALGVWPFADVFMSTEADNLLVATLSAGPIGIGDRIGTMSTANLLRAVRPDGIIVKPDVPITPLDSTFQSDAHTQYPPLVGSTYTDFGGLRAYYVFAFPQATNLLASFRLSDFGMNQAAYVYNYSDGTGRVITPADTFSETIDQGFVYHVVTPIGRSGIAVIGDTGQFVTLGKKRITAMADDGTVQLSVAYAKGETSRTIEGYSPVKPAVIATTGTIGPVSYDAASKRFLVPVLPGDDAIASIRISIPVTYSTPINDPLPIGTGGHTGVPPNRTTISPY